MPNYEVKSVILDVSDRIILGMIDELVNSAHRVDLFSRLHEYVSGPVSADTFPGRVEQACIEMHVLSYVFEMLKI